MGISGFLKSLGAGIFTLISVIVVVSAIIYLAPVDPSRLSFGQRSDQKTIDSKKREMGLDQSLSVQLGLYLLDLSPVYIGNKQFLVQRYHKSSYAFIGSDIGFGFKWPYLRISYMTGRNVSEMLLERIPQTLILAISAFGFASLFGIILGILSAVSRGSLFDQLIILFSSVGISVPSYLSAVFFAILFGFVLAPFTGLNLQGSLFEYDDLGNPVTRWQNLILPALALGLRPIAVVTQLTRSSLLDVMGMDYIRTAKAKGLPWQKILFGHALQNAMNPVVTSLTGWFASLIAGAYFVEKVFNYRGVGDLTITALLNYDIPVILGALLLICCFFIIVNLLTDQLYRLIDVRSKQSS